MRGTAYQRLRTGVERACSPITHVDLAVPVRARNTRETLRNAVGAHLSTRSSISPHVERHARIVLVVAVIVIGHVKDESIGTHRRYWNTGRSALCARISACPAVFPLAVLRWTVENGGYLRR